MLVMRKEQMAALKQLAQHGFEAEMLDHLAGFSPRLFKLAGKESMQRAISFGIERAKSYGFDLRGPVRLYLELMVLFGSHFDTDPQYPWAAEILADAKSASVPQAQRAERLYMKAVECRQMIAGTNEAYVLKASRKIAQIIRHSPELSPDDFTSEMLRLAKSVHPEKADYVGDGVLEALIRKGMDAGPFERARRLFVVHAPAGFRPRLRRRPLLPLDSPEPKERRRGGTGNDGNPAENDGSLLARLFARVSPSGPPDASRTRTSLPRRAGSACPRPAEPTCRACFRFAWIH